MNKRELKKRIQNVCGELAAVVLFESEIGKQKDPEKVGKLIDKIAGLQVESLKNATFAYDKTQRQFENRGAYLKARSQYYQAGYNKLIDNFDAAVADIILEINTLAKEA